jgi:hypothetical protein
VFDGVGIGVMVGVMVGVNVSVGVCVIVGVSAGRGVSVGVSVGCGVGVSVGVGVGELSAPQAAATIKINSKNIRIRDIPARHNSTRKDTMKPGDLLRWTL